MSPTTDRLRWPAVHVDGYGLLLAVLLVGVTVGSVAAVPPLQADESGDGEATGVQQDERLADRSATEQAAAGGGWAVLEAGVAVTMLTLILVWRRLPDIVQEIIKNVIEYALLIYAGSIIARGPVGLGAGMAIVLGVYVAYRLITHADLWWIVNDALALSIAVGLGAVAGIWLGLPFLVAGMVGLTAYDHYFANKNPWMATLADYALRWRLPALIVVPTTLRLDWDRLAELAAAIASGDGDDAEFDQLAFGIGMADLLLPAAVAAAVTAHTATVTVGGVPVEVWGILAGLAVAGFRLRWELEHKGSGAGLPTITAGTLVGWGVGAVVVALV